MEELQQEEREVILSIYDCDPAFKQLSPVTFQYKYGEEGDRRSFLLELSWTEEYPNVAPKINMNTFYNKHLTDAAKEKVCKYVLEESENFMGCAMTYSLFEGVKEKHFELIGADDINDTPQPTDAEKRVENASPEDEAAPQRKTKKEQLTKAQKRKQWNRVDCHGERPRGWDWVDVIHHLSQTGQKKSDTPLSC